MPSEAARLSRPIGPRDRRFFAALTVLAAVGVAAAVLLFGHSGSGTTTEGCLTYDAAGVLGGGTWHLCGTDATAFCKAHAASDAALAAKCDELDKGV